MEKYRHEKQFFIKYCDTDFKDEMKVSTALSLFEEVACSSADELGFGYEFLKPKGIAFLVSGVRLRFSHPVRLGETVTVCTWPTPPSYAVFGREYQMLSESGEIFVSASSRWCAVDLKTGKVLSSKFLEGQDYSTYNTDRALTVENWKIPSFPLEEGELRYTLTVANSEYDHYMHVNNTRYADYCLNAFSVAELKVARVKDFAVSYAKQCKEGETLRFYRKRTNEGAFIVQGVKESGEIAVLCEISFEKTEGENA